VLLEEKLRLLTELKLILRTESLPVTSYFFIISKWFKIVMNGRLSIKRIILYC
jgi:hypothetical protein